MVGVIVTGLLLLVRGEAEFDLAGFALVMTASMLSGLRFTLTQVLLHGPADSAKSHGGDHGGWRGCWLLGDGALQWVCWLGGLIPPAASGCRPHLAIC